MPRFISKSPNLMIVLKPGLPASPITGTPAKATVSVRFKDGLADVPEGELATLMFAHPGFNSDYIHADVGTHDPYAMTRQPSEPAHVMTEIKFGNTVGRKVSETKPTLPPEIANLVNEMAVKLAKEMLPGMVKETLKSLMTEHKAQKEEEAPVVATKEASAPKKRKGNPNWQKKTAKVVEENPRAEVDAG